ncbi:MAG: electron transport complex subunit RsxC [bacterium]
MKNISFKGGIHPPGNKAYTKDESIEKAELPKEVHIPLQQHIGAPAEPIVKVGDTIKTGQMIGKAGGYVSAPVHASLSGEVVNIAPYPHPMGQNVSTITIKSDQKDEWITLSNKDEDIQNLSKDDLLKGIMDAGIVGLGGAAFPCHVKLKPPADKPIDTLLINGAECEPYLNSDYRLMLERADDIVAGIDILIKIMQVKNVYLGIEDNKPDAFDVMEKSVKSAGKQNLIKVVTLQTKYPQGGEKQLIQAITNRQVPPPPALPMDVGVVVHNVGTALAVFEAVQFKKPLIERVVSITGPGIKRPRNLLVRLGTTIEELINQCGGLSSNPYKVIMGGPMMGIAQYDLHVPVIKGTSGILVLPENGTVNEDNEYYTCIRCKRCLVACPMELIPSQIGILCEKGKFEELEEYVIMSCMECGSCTYVCPSKRPLVQFIKYGKSELLKRRRKGN